VTKETEANKDRTRKDSKKCLTVDENLEEKTNISPKPIMCIVLQLAQNS